MKVATFLFTVISLSALGACDKEPANPYGVLEFREDREDIELPLLAPDTPYGETYAPQEAELLME